MSEQIGLSQRAFAAEVGKDQSWVRRWLAAGKLPRDKYGKIPLEAGKKAAALIESEQAAKKRKADAKKLMGKDVMQAAGDSADGDDTLIGVEGELSAGEVVKAFNRARMEEKRAQAELKKIELEIKRGDFVSVDEVKADATAIASLVRERALSMPARFAGLCEGRTQREIESVLEDAARDILSVFEKSKFVEKS